MKILFLPLCVLFVTPSAFAMHAYGTDHCTAITLENQEISFDLANGRPASPHRLAAPEGFDDTNAPLFVSLDQSKDSQDEPVATSDLVLKVTANVVTGSKKLDDGCFVGEAHTSVRTATVLQQSKRLQGLFSLSVGEVLHLTCYSDAVYPEGNGCGK